MQAVQRLTAYDEQLIKKICGILNKLYRKGKELEKMTEDIKIFKEKAIKEENTLRKTKGKRCAVSPLKLNFRYY